MEEKKKQKDPGIGIPGLPGRFAELGRLGRRLLGLPHNVSVHPGGIVIGRGPIDRYVPLQPSAKGVRITQYDKRGIKDIRLVKLDLLGNRNLSTIRHACDLIRRRRGVSLDIESIPTADPATLARLTAGETVGCNQLESPAMRHLLKMLQPRGLADVMKALALIRPGAASIGMKDAFVRRHRGFEPVPPAPPRAAGVLDKTYGIMLYEDDVMLLAAALLGTDLPEADRFRKAVQKCHSDEKRRALSEEFLSRCRARGVEPAYARDAWVQMAKFNAYSFCRAHAASYAQLAYAGAYLRTHFATEFWVAALNNNQSMYHPRVYVEQAKRCGIRFLLPDVNRSGEEFTLEGDAIRVGLNRIAEIGPICVQRILTERRRRKFESLSDLLLWTRLARKPARSLVLCGAMDSLGRSRPTLMMELNLFLTLRPQHRPSQGTLLPQCPTIPNVRGDYDPHRKRRDERQLLGISVGEHILSWYRPALANLTDADSRDLPRRVGKRVQIAGVLEASRTMRARNQDQKTMSFLTLDDEFGLFDVTLLPDVCKSVRGGLGRYGPYLITGRVRDHYGSIAVAAERTALLNIPVDSAQESA